MIESPKFQKPRGSGLSQIILLARDGRIDEAREYCKRIRDAGVMVGVSTHIPDVVDYVVSAGWDVDFFMTCVYERHRTREELRALLGHVPIPVREVYLESDPPRMFEAMRQTDKPCLAFKILAANRKCATQQDVRDAFRFAFDHIKDGDAVGGKEEIIRLQVPVADAGRAPDGATSRRGSRRRSSPRSARSSPTMP